MALNAICELNIRKKLTHRLTRIYNDIYQYDTNRIKYQKPVNHTIYRLLVEFNIHLVGMRRFYPYAASRLYTIVYVKPLK